jgi:hypothetical protein
MPGFTADETTGLLNWYVGTIEESFAGTNAQYRDGTVTRLTWETVVDDVLQEDYDGEIPPSITRNITLGDGWDTDEDGVLYHEDDEARIERGLEAKDFKITSFYGNLIALIAGQTNDWSGKYEVIDGGPDELDTDLRPVMKYFESQGFDDPRDPKIWLGLTFEFRTIKVQFDREQSYTRTVPVRLVNTPDAKSVKRSRKSAPKAEAEPFNFEEFGADKVLSDKLNGILQSSRSESEFVQKALQVSGVPDNEALMAALVSDEGPWSKK